MFVVDAPGGRESQGSQACSCVRRNAGNFTHIPEVNIGRKTAAENMKNSLRTAPK